MSNIINYINRYGHLTFDELKLNKLDELVFSVLSYVDFDGILENNKYHKVRLEDAANEYFKKYGKKEVDSYLQGVIAANKVFDYIKNENRYKDLYLYNYSYKRDHDKQFSALFIDIDPKLTFVSFEGTDDLISGWKEDFQMTYMFPIPAQREAIKYINKSIPLFTDRKYIFGGHSKGGNLSVVAAMYANPLIKPKIKRIVSFDGPGLKDEQFNSKHYRSIDKKVELIVPDSCLIGILLNHRKNQTVIKSSMIGPMAHSFNYWDVDETKFIPSKLTKGSKETERIINEWLAKYNDKEREFLVKEMFSVFDRAHIESLTDIKLSNIGKIKAFIDESKKLDAEAQVMLKTLTEFFMTYLKNDTRSKLKSLTGKK